ncbi:DNA repair protein RecN, partial [Acinetobacter baumannii]|nr:DNA repair protein RecN [Acinetobacter baumannii]
PQGQFKVELKRDEESRPRRDGRDDVSFLFTANLGEPLQVLGTVASGGELSRLALAIEVLTASKSSVPTLIFDEIDAG